MCGLRKPPQIWPQSRATHPKGPDFPPTQQRPCADFWRARKRAPKSPERQNLAQLHVTPTSTHHTEVAVTNPRPSCTTRIREHQCDTIGWLSARAHATQYARHHHQCFRKKKTEIRRADHARRFIVCAFKPRHRSLVRSTRPQARKQKSGRCSALAFVPSFAAGVHDGPVVSQGCSDDARTDPGR